MVAHPIMHVTWFEAEAYCNWLANELGKPIRLPTEEEWERAARGGTTTPFSFSTPATWDTLCGAFPEAEPYMWWCFNSGGSRSVAGKLPNPYALYDMHGNVWEWVQDWYSSDYYSSSPLTDPPGPASGSGRVLRGGPARPRAGAR